MIVRQPYPEEKEKFNQAVQHPLQSWQWGEFRQKTGAETIRLAQFDGQELKTALQLTLHSLPKTSYKIGYLPKCGRIDEQLFQSLKQVGRQNNCFFIKIEPQLTKGQEFFLDRGCVYGRPLFTKYTFQIYLRQDEKVLLAKMKPKTRYNLRLAQKKGVKIEEDNSLTAFKQYLKLTFQTTKRQKFYAHDEEYHRQMWQVLYPAGIAHLLKASYQGKVLVTWIVFLFNHVLYYPYGASSRKNREAMASNLMMWEAIRFGQRKGCRLFDLWGCLGPKASPQDPWFGFHRFKEGYSPKLIEFIGTFDLVLNPSFYKAYRFLNSLRWKWLKIKNLF